MLWIKALHIIFVVCWFAGIFYLPRLFVYHAMSQDPAIREQLSLMERKLFRFMTPLAVLAVFFGLWLVMLNPVLYLSTQWFHAKAALVIALIVYHWQCGRYIDKLAEGSVQRSHIFFRWFNETPTLILFAVVILVVVRPF